MKNLSCKTIFAILLFTGVANAAFAQKNEAPKTPAFFITVQKTADGLSLTSQGGTAWNKLSFTIKDDVATVIDQYGMSSLQREKKFADKKLANFLFTVKKTKDGLSFEGIEGTAWTTLTSACSGLSCRQLIDQEGITVSK